MLKGFYFLLIWPYFEAFSGLFEDFGKWLDNRMQRWRTEGFTLVEISMVLVIIGLLVGGVLVGVDLVKAAETRAQITQVQKFDSAVNTFRNKYNGIPGDLQAQQASQFGFTVPADCDGQTASERNGDGLIQGYPVLPYSQTLAETELFWVDLTTARLIEGQYLNNTTNTLYCLGAYSLTLTPGNNYVGDYLPPAKIGYNNFVYVYANNGFNWFGVSEITSINFYGGVPTSGANIPVAQAANIDKKIDDGLPASGNVQALYLTAGSPPSTVVQSAFSANPDTASTCYNSSTNTYSTNINNGSGPNCALSFKMQGAAR